MKKLILALLTLTIIGCGSSGDSAVNTVNSTPADDNPKFEIIFKEDFENLPDWESDLKNPNGDLSKPITNNPPKNWNHVYAFPTWSPSRGHDDRLPNISIKEHNPIMVRSGKRSAVFTRDAYSQPSWQWKSDGILAKTLDKDYKQLYIEFYIKYNPNSKIINENPETAFPNRGKIFRVLSWDRKGDFIANFEGSVTKPTAGYLYSSDDYGVRHVLMLRGHPTTGDNSVNNYYFAPYQIKNLPKYIRDGDISLNYGKHIRDLNGDGVVDNEIKSFFSAIDGKPVGSHGKTVWHREVWGDKNTNSIWRKFSIFVNMNSKPGAEDGVYKFWIDDNLIFSNANIPWIGHAATEMKAWNSIKLGGNDYIKSTPTVIIPDSERIQDWYAIDDLIIATAIPEHLKQ